MNQYGYSNYLMREQRSRSDWSGIGIEDAFRGSEVSYVVRATARRMFSQKLRHAQLAAAQAAGRQSLRNYSPRVKPQIAACYTSYPRGAAANAAIGNTIYLEFLSNISADYLTLLCRSEEKAIAKMVQQSGASEDDITTVIGLAARAVESRLYATCLLQDPALAPVETYRLFLASRPWEFSTITEILEAAILFGDIIPPLRYLDLHPRTEAVLKELIVISRPYFRLLPDLAPSQHLETGVTWTMNISRKIARHLPKAEAENRRARPNGSLNIPPLDKPKPPLLTSDSLDPRDRLRSELTRAMTGEESGEKADEGRKRMQKPLEEFMRAIYRVGMREADWEDPRPELLERRMRARSYQRAPIEGDQMLGFEYSVPMGENEEQTSELFERVMQEEGPPEVAQQLKEDAGPLAENIRQLLYPNISSTIELERLRATGSLDPGRLPYAGISDAVYRKAVSRRELDARGRPVIVLCIDASASLSRRRQVPMIRMLCSAWLQSIRLSQVQIMCAFYNGAVLRSGDEGGAQVSWLTHPHKAPARDSEEAHRILAAFTHGRGAQSDAISIHFAASEALAVARGRSTYLIVITDGKFNKSFLSSQTPSEEVTAMFIQLRADFAQQLHTTMVVLGDHETGVKEAIDAEIRVREEDLQDIPVVAKNIAEYVAAMVRERRNIPHR